MDRPTRIAIMPAVILLCGLAGCVVAGPPPQREVVVERPAPPQAVYVRPPPPEVVVRP
jgi:hypothetical protein